MPRKELFKIHNVAERTGYHIPKEGNTRRGPGVHNRGRKRILADHQCAAIEAIEDADFYFASSSHYKVAKKICLAEGSKRAIQRNMADFGVGTYRALQKKWLPKHSIEARNLWAHERRYFHLEDFQRYRWCDESHFATALQRQALVHRRCGQENREKLSKPQYKTKKPDYPRLRYNQLELQRHSPLLHRHWEARVAYSGRLC